MAAANMCRVVVIFTLFYCFRWCNVFAATKTQLPDGPVAITSVPFVASLQAARGSRLVHVCAASVVHEKFLLTAASCFVDPLGDQIKLTKALVGTNDLTDGGQYFDIQAMFPHEKYSLKTGDYNVGLVKLLQRLVFGPTVGRVLVGKTKLKVGSLVKVVGWGSNGKLEPSTSTLQLVSVPILNRKTCQNNTVGRIVTKREICAGAVGVGKGDCVSDEGGPLTYSGALVGVATPRCGCGRLPALYTRLSATLGWVTATVDMHLSYLDYFDV